MASNPNASSASSPNIPNKTRFIDLVENEKNAIHKLEATLGELKAREARVEKLGQADALEMQRITELLALKGGSTQTVRFDPLFVALRQALARDDGSLMPVAVYHENGTLGFEPRTNDEEHN